MLALRKLSVHRARQLEWLYKHFERALIALHPHLLRIGYARLERPVAFIERHCKAWFFDCKMCGRCILSSTGMSCPMNCPKQMRNGPCGGVRANGNCEVKPDMRCVWVDAYRGSRAMHARDKIMSVQPQVDWSRRGTSSWLREVRARMNMREGES